MPRGRPPLRIGEHGNIVRTQISGGVWEARCHYRSIDGLTHRPKKKTPKGVYDRYGAAAEAALVEYLETLRGQGRSVAAQTLVTDLLDRHMETLEAVERAPRTLDTYRRRLKN